MADSGDKEVEQDGEGRDIFSAYEQETVVGQSNVVGNAVESERPVFKKPSVPVGKMADSKTHPALVGSKETVSSEPPESRAVSLQNASTTDSCDQNVTSTNTETDRHVVISLKFKDGMFFCVTCNTLTCSANGFDEHIAKHILAKPYICLDCRVTFESKADTDSHAASVHKEEQLKCGLRGMKKIRQITDKLKQLGCYTFKGIIMKKSINMNKHSTESTTTTATSVVSTSPASQGSSSTSNISTSLELQRQDPVSSNPVKESCSLIANTLNTNSNLREKDETNLFKAKTTLQSHPPSSFATSLVKQSEMNRNENSSTLPTWSSQSEVQLPSKQSEVQLPSKQSEMQLPLKQSEVQLPSKQSEVQLSSKQSEVQLPSNQSEVQLPSKQSEVQLPLKQSEVQLPSKQSRVQLPSKLSEVQLSSKQSEVQLPSNQSEVQHPSKQNEVQLPSSQRELQLPSSQSEVQLLSKQSELQLPLKQSEMQLSSKESEGQLPSKQSEVQLPSSQREVQLPSSQREVQLPLKESEVQLPLKESEVQHPSKQSEVQPLLKQSELQLPFSQNELQLTSSQSELQLPSSQREVQLPLKESEVQHPSKESEVQHPSKQREVQLPLEQSEVQLPSKQSEVQLPLEQSEVQLPSKQSELQLPSKQSEVQLPSKQNEFQLPSEQNEVVLTSEQIEVQLSSKQSEVQLSSKQSEMQLPLQQSQVQLPSKQNQAQLSSKQSEVQLSLKQSEVQLPSKQSEVHLPFSQSEVQLPSKQHEVLGLGSRSESGRGNPSEHGHGDFYFPTTDKESQRSVDQNKGGTCNKYDNTSIQLTQETIVTKSLSLVPSSINAGDRSTVAIQKAAAEMTSGSVPTYCEKHISGKTPDNELESKNRGKFVITPDISQKLKQTLQDALFVKTQQKLLSLNSSDTTSNSPAGASIESTNESTGNEVVNKSSGSEVVNMSTGNEVVNKSTGNEAVNKSTGNEVVNKSTGNEVVNKSSGKEVVNISTEKEVVNKFSGNEEVNKYSGNEEVNKSLENEVVNKSSGNDVVNKSTGNEVVNNSVGNEVVNSIRIGRIEGDSLLNSSSNTATNITGLPITSCSGSSEIIDDLNSVNSNNENILSANLPSLYRTSHNKRKLSDNHSSDENIDKPGRNDTPSISTSVESTEKSTENMCMNNIRTEWTEGDSVLSGSNKAAKTIGSNDKAKAVEMGQLITSSCSNEIDDLNSVNSANEDILSANLPSLYRTSHTKRKSSGNSDEKIDQSGRNAASFEDQTLSANKDNQTTAACNAGSAVQRTTVPDEQSLAQNPTASSVRPQMLVTEQPVSSSVSRQVYPQHVDNFVRHRTPAATFTNYGPGVNRFPAPNVTVQSARLEKVVKTKRVTVSEETIRHVKQFNSTTINTNTPVTCTGNSVAPNPFMYPSFQVLGGSSNIQNNRVMPQNNQAVGISGIRNINFQAVSHARLPSQYIGSTSVYGQTFPVLFVPGQTVQTGCRGDNPVHAQYTTQPQANQRNNMLQSSQFMQIQQGQEQANCPVLRMQAAPCPANVTSQCSFIPQTVYNHAHKNQSLQSQGNETRQQRPSILNQGYHHYQNYNNLERQSNMQNPRYDSLPVNSTAVQAQQTPAASYQVQGNFQLGPFSQQHPGQLVSMPQPSMSYSTSYQSFPISQIPQTHRARILRPHHNVPNSNSPQSAQVNVFQGTTGVTLTTENTMQLPNVPCTSNEPKRRNVKSKKSKQKDQTSEVINMANQNSEAAVPKTNATEISNSDISTDKNESGNKDNCGPQLSDQDSANKHPETHMDRRKQTLTTRENLNEEVTISVEKSTTSLGEQKRDSAAVNPTLPVDNIVSDTTSSQNVDTDVTSASSDIVSVQNDQDGQQTKASENNKNEQNKGKKTKSKGSFIRVGTSFLCNQCRMETEDLNYFRKHVWIHIHVKKRYCKECPTTAGGSSASSCQNVNSIMNGLIYGSAGNVTKKIKKEPEEVVTISDDDDDEGNVADNNNKRETEQNCTEIKTEVTEVPPLVIKEEESPEECFSQSQESDSSSIVYEGTVKKVAPLKMQIKLPHPYKLRKEKKKVSDDNREKAAFGRENDNSIEETSESDTRPEITTDREGVDNSVTGTKQSQVRREKGSCDDVSIVGAKTNNLRSQEDYSPTESSSNQPENDSSEAALVNHRSTNGSITETHISRDTHEVEHSTAGIMETIPLNQTSVESNNSEENATESATNRQRISVDDNTMEQFNEIPRHQRNIAIENASAANACHQREDSNFYICTIKGCGYSSMTSKDYLDHLNVQHKNENKLMCVHCGLFSKRPDEHIRHMHGHLKPNNKHSVFVCEICPFQVNLLKTFIQHLNTNHNQVQNFTCFFCKEMLPGVLHMKQHCERNLLKCVQCGHCTVKDADRQVIVKHIKESHPGMHIIVKVTKQLVCRDRENNHYRQQETNRQTVEEENLNETSLDVATLSSEDITGCENDIELETVVPVGPTTITEPVSPITNHQQSQVPSEPLNGSNDNYQNRSFLPGTATKENTEPQLDYELRKCTNCSYVGKTDSLFQEHSLLHRPNEQGSNKQFQCPECPDSCDTLKALKGHLACHLGTHQLTLIYCEVCEFVSNVMDILTSHILCSHPSCSESIDHYMSSRKIKVSSHLLCCDTCGFLSALEEDFNCHIRAHENEKALMTVTSMLRPFPIPAGDNYRLPVSCCECSFSTKSRVHLVNHVNKHPSLFPDFLEEEMSIERHNESSVTEKRTEPMEKTDNEQNGNSNNQLKEQRKSSDVLPATVENSTQNLQMLRDKPLNENTEENKLKEVQKKRGTQGEISDGGKVLPRVPERIRDNRAIFLGSDFLHEKLQNSVVKLALPDESYRCRICRRTMKSKYEVHKHVLKHFNVWMFKCGYCNHKTLESSKLHLHSKNVHPGVPMVYKKVNPTELKGRIQKGRRRLILKLSTEMTSSQTIRQWVHKSKDGENTNLMGKQKEVDLPQGGDEIREMTDDKGKRDERDKSVDNENVDRSADNSLSEQMSLSSSETSHKDTSKSSTEIGRLKVIKVGNQYICSICGLESNISQKMSVHMRWHRRQSNIKCQCCSFVARNIFSLQNHLKRFHNEEYNSRIFRHSSSNNTADGIMARQRANSGASASVNRSRTLNVSQKGKEAASETQDDARNSEEDSDDENRRPLTRKLEKKLLEKYSSNVKSNHNLPKESLASSDAVKKLNTKFLDSGVTEAKQKNQTNSIECSKIDRSCPLTRDWITSKVKVVESNFSCGLCSKEFASKSNVERHIVEVCCKKESSMRDFASFKSKSVGRNRNDSPSTQNRAASSSPRPNFLSKTLKKQSPLVKKNSNLEDLNTKKKIVVSKHSTSSGKLNNVRSIVINSEKQRHWVLSKIKMEGRSFKCGLCRFTSMYRGNLKRHILNVHNKEFENASAGKVEPSSRPDNTEGKLSLQEQGNPMRRIAIFKCNSCKTSFKSEIKVQEHIRKSCTKTLYRCTLCPFYFNTDQRHVKSHSKQKHGHTIVPAVCLKSERYKQFSIPWHESTLNKKQGSPCKSDSVPSEETTSKPRVLNYSKKNMTQAYCRECKFEAFSLQALQIHRNRKHQNQLFSCGICNTFCSQSILQLKNHTKSKHRKARNMKFFICSRKSPNSSDNKETSSNQVSDSSVKDSESDNMDKICYSTNGNQIFCSECNYKSLNYNRFQHHCYKAHRKSSLLCFYCKTFKGSTVVQLELHCIESHKKQDLKFTFVDSVSDMPVKFCILPQCKYAIRNVYQYKEHLYTHLNYRPYSCKYCSYSSIRRDTVLKHIQGCHPLKADSGMNKQVVICSRKDAVEMKVKKLLQKSNIDFLKPLKDVKKHQAASNSFTRITSFSKVGVGVTALINKKKKVIEMNTRPRNFYEKRIVRGKVEYYCIKCPAKYPHIGSIWYHVRYQHMRKDNQCPLCKASHHSRYLLQKHMQLHHQGNCRRRPTVTPEKVKQCTRSEEEQTDVYSDEDVKRTRSQSQNVPDTAVQQPRKRKLTKKRSIDRNKDLSSSDSDTDSEDGTKKPRKSPKRCSKKRKDNSPPTSPLIVEASTVPTNDLLSSEDWYRCHMCSYCTNDIRYFSRHLVCHGTFTRFTPGEKIKSTVTNTIIAESKPASLFLCSYCSNYEHTLSAMRQHSDRCHPYNVFDCTKVATSGLGTTETLVDLQPKVIVTDKCKTNLDRLATLADKQCAEDQQESNYSTDDSQDIVDNSCTENNYFDLQKEETDTTKHSVSEKEKLTCSGTETVRDSSLETAELQCKGDNSGPVETEEKILNEKYSPVSYNKQSGALASIMDAYSGMYDSLSDEDESMEEESEGIIETVTENGIGNIENVEPSENDKTVTVSNEDKSDSTELETICQEGDQDSCFSTSVETCHEDNDLAINTNSSAQSLPDVAQPDKISFGDTNTEVGGQSLVKETPTIVDQSDKFQAVKETNSYVGHDGDSRDGKGNVPDSEKLDFYSNTEPEMLDTLCENTTPPVLTAGSEGCLEDSVEVNKSEQTGTVEMESQNVETIVCTAYVCNADSVYSNDIQYDTDAVWVTDMKSDDVAEESSNLKNVGVFDSVGYTNILEVRANDFVESTDTEVVTVNNSVESTKTGDVKVVSKVGTDTEDASMNNSVKSTNTMVDLVNNSVESTNTGYAMVESMVIDSEEGFDTGDAVMNDFVESTNAGDVTVNGSVEANDTGDIMMDDSVEGSDTGDVTVNGSVESTDNNSDITVVDFVEGSDTGYVMVNDSVEGTDNKSDITVVDSVEGTDKNSDITVVDSVEGTDNNSDITLVDSVESSDNIGDITEADSVEGTDNNHDITIVDSVEVVDDRDGNGGSNITVNDFVDGINPGDVTGLRADDSVKGTSTGDFSGNDSAEVSNTTDVTLNNSVERTKTEDVTVNDSVTENNTADVMVNDSVEGTGTGNITLNSSLEGINNRNITLNSSVESANTRNIMLNSSVEGASTRDSVVSDSSEGINNGDVLVNDIVEQTDTEEWVPLSEI